MWIWDWMQQAGARARLISAAGSIGVSELTAASALHGPLESLRDRRVLLISDEPLSAALALIELDGLVERLVICPPDLKPEHLPAVIEAAQADTLVASPGIARPAQPVQSITLGPGLRTAGALARECRHETEWILLTSGTSGPPKLVVHTLATLIEAFAHSELEPVPPVWSTFYDLRRYGGLQILLRALRGSILVVPAVGQNPAAHLPLAAAAGVTHLTGTASHWRSILMSGQSALISPRYLRLSGEIADQGILDALHAAYPRACIAHAFASTEAGVAFEVEDGRAGFPAAWVDADGPDGAQAHRSPAVHRPGRHPGDGGGPVAQMRVVEGTLRLRSAGAARAYLASTASLRDAEGFVDTADRVELREGRYYFLGRSGGIINVGGLKVHPEEVEAVINAQPWVRVSRVRARRNPITGAVVSAEVVLCEPQAQTQRPADTAISEQIMTACRAALAEHKVPAVIRIVPSLPVSAAGKLVRHGA